MDGWLPSEFKTLMEMAAAGLGIESICQELKRRQRDIREVAEMLGLSLIEVEYPMVCPRCGSGFVIGDDDWCPKCQLEEKVVRWQREEQEEVNLLRQVERYDATKRKQRERRREKAGTNPRKGPNAELLRLLKKHGLPDFEEMEEEFDSE